MATSIDGWTIREERETRVVTGGGVTVRVPYSVAFLHELARFRPNGTDLVDELLRSEYPDYVLERLRVLLAGFPVGSWRVLDFGCGAGASAVCLARLGVGRIVGVDIVNEYGAVWERRLAEAGHPGVGAFVQVGDQASLPFGEGQFDAVFLNGLVEHLLPEERPRILREVLRVIRPGGHLFLTETPNRWFPRNSHTKLWFSELLPFGVASRLASRLGPRHDFPVGDRNPIYRTGMRGASVRQVKRALGKAAVLIPPPRRIVEMEFLVPRNPLDSSPRKQKVGRVAWKLARAGSRLTREPLHVLSPHLNLIFQKHP